MRPLLFCVCLMACEQMDPSGDPLAPVDVSNTGATKPSPEAQSADADEETQSTDMPFRISSEELQAAAGAIEEGSSPEDALANATGEAVAEVKDPAEAEAAEVETEEAAAPATALSEASGEWPIRLVVTMPNTQPPRAVVGLPDGREIVVTAGDLIPDIGMVVMSVGATSVQMAKVTAAGDHAQIANFTLSAMY